METGKERGTHMGISFFKCCAFTIFRKKTPELQALRCGENTMHTGKTRDFAGDK
jgi:hypothetical protein